MEKSEIEHMFSSLGPVVIRPMFGGKGVYCKDVIIAVEYHGDILVKADDVSAAAFESAGATRWAYEGKAGKAVNMPYWSIPADAFDDPGIMARWVKLAYDAALRSAKVKGDGRQRNRRGR